MAQELDLRSVVVTGDVILEWRLAKSKINKRQPENAPLVDPRSYIQLSYEPTGAALIGKLIEHALKGQSFNVLAPRPRNENNPGRPAGFFVSLAVCSEQRMIRTGDDGGRAVWRIDSRLGIDRGRRGEIDRRWHLGGNSGAKPYLVPTSSTGEEDVGRARLVVLEQGRHGFDESRNDRDESREGDDETLDFWPESLRTPPQGAWLLARWSRPGAPNQKRLWRHVVREFRGRIIVVITADHLRYIGAWVTRSLSWEHTAEELFRAVKLKWEEVFEGCRYLVVSLLPSGAFIFEKTGDVLTGRLIYDRSHLDTSWSDGYAGEMMGYTKCLTAAIAAKFMRQPSADITLPEIAGGVAAGLTASRLLLVRGFEVKEFPDGERRNTMLPESLRFPVGYIGDVIENCLRDDPFAEARLSTETTPGEYGKTSPATPDEVRAQQQRDARMRAEHVRERTEPIRTRRSFASVRFDGPISDEPWSILSTVLNDADRVLKYARGIIEWGRTFRDDVFRYPLLRIGKLFTIDRVEMEGLRHVQSLMKDYIHAPFVFKPLSIAVFGPPGAGKSFAIKEIARGLAGRGWPGDPDVHELTFNLSQFTRAKSIGSALQQVRDVSLAGKTPLVFWDEFDTHFEIEFGWLQHFLSPMQDGQFQDGSMTYHVGRAIFVFAGSLFCKQQEFERFVEEEVRRKADLVGKPRGASDRESTERPFAKSPDFRSRLVGFVDVPTLDYENSEYLDVSVMLRRAGLLRSLLRQEGGEPLLQYVRDPNDSRGENHLRRRIIVDRGVANAFLQVTKFNYNARSVEAIVKMSTLRGKDTYERSSLPPSPQLGLHVDAKEFIAYVEDQQEYQRKRKIRPDI